MGVLSQIMGTWDRPEAYPWKRLDNGGTGWPGCLQAVAAVALLVREANKLTLGQDLIIKVAHEVNTFLQVQFSSVSQLCPTLCDSMNHSTPGLPVHHKLPEFTQTHVHRVGDAIQPSHPLLSPSPPAPNPSQHQGLFQ